jgi:hypothetical protein
MGWLLPIALVSHLTQGIFPHSPLLDGFEINTLFSASSHTEQSASSHTVISNCMLSHWFEYSILHGARHCFSTVPSYI